MGDIVPPWIVYLGLCHLYLDLLIVVTMILWLCACPISVFVSVLIRFRADYNPRNSNALPYEDGSEGHSISRRPFFGYWSMVARIWKFEGWRGYFKGIFPLSMRALIFAGCLTFSILNNFLRGQKTLVPQADGWQVTYLFAAVEFFMIPYNVLAVRVIVSPRLLGIPWYRYVFPRNRIALYRLPGLFVTQLLHILIGQFVLRAIRGPLIWLKPVVWWRYTTYFALVEIISILFLTPLEVVAVRLSLPPPHLVDQAEPVAANPSLTTVENDVEAGPEATPTESPNNDPTQEAVLNLRSDRPPYSGFIDCLRTIKIEEGLGTLYRGWWMTVIMTSLGILLHMVWLPDRFSF